MRAGDPPQARLTQARLTPAASSSMLGVEYSMHPETTYTSIDGEDSGHDIVVYGLTRCEPCKEARSYLESRGWAYKYVHLERQPQQIRQEMKKEFAEAHGKRPLFPVLELDGELHFGFSQAAWERWINGSSPERS